MQMAESSGFFVVFAYFLWKIKVSFNLFFSKFSYEIFKSQSNYAHNSCVKCATIFCFSFAAKQPSLGAFQHVKKYNMLFRIERSSSAVEK